MNKLKKRSVVLVRGLLALCVLCCMFACSSENGSTSRGASTYTNSIGMEFVKIPAGSYMRGCDSNFENCLSDAIPQQRINISSFYLGKYEVTQEQWVAVMGSNPSHFKGRANPVEYVSWNDIQEFVRRLNAKEGHNRYRLPTEAEWEYAARAGSTTAYSFGDNADELGTYAWYGEDWGGGSPHPVGQKKTNVWGLYDMYGNVWEWCSDWYNEKYYSWSKKTDDPSGPSSGVIRVRRGGSWSNGAEDCRSANRDGNTPDVRNINFGFRLVLSLKQIGAATGEDGSGTSSSSSSVAERNATERENLKGTQSAMPDKAFIELCKKGTADEVRRALAYGANVCAKDKDGWTALMYAAAENPNPEVVKALLRGGAEVNAKNKDGATALMLAAVIHTDPEVVKMLLKSRADIHARHNKYGMTALMYAALNNANPEVVKILLENGADVCAVCKNGHDAVWYAQQNIENGKEEIIRILKEYASCER